MYHLCKPLKDHSGCPLLEGMLVREGQNLWPLPAVALQWSAKKMANRWNETWAWRTHVNFYYSMESNRRCYQEVTRTCFHHLILHFLWEPVLPWGKVLELPIDLYHQQWTLVVKVNPGDCPAVGKYLLIFQRMRIRQVMMHMKETFFNCLMIILVYHDLEKLNCDEFNCLLCVYWLLYSFKF